MIFIFILYIFFFLEKVEYTNQLFKCTKFESFFKKFFLSISGKDFKLTIFIKMDSMTAEKAQWLREKMSLLEDCFNQLIDKSCHEKAKIQKNEKEKFSSLYKSICDNLNSYQRCKVGVICRSFNELSALFSNVFKSSNVQGDIKFNICHQVLPIFAIVDQEIDLSNQPSQI